MARPKALRWEEPVAAEDWLEAPSEEGKVVRRSAEVGKRQMAGILSPPEGPLKP